MTAAVDLRSDLYKGPARRHRRILGRLVRPPVDQVLCDGSWWKPDPEKMPHAGFIGYLTRDTTGKRLMPAQCRAFLAAGKTVNLVGQDGKRQAMRGAAGGREDALFYNRQADEDGAPPWLPIVYAVADFDASPAELRGPIHSYTGAVLETVAKHDLRPVGPYGGIRTIDYLADAFGPSAFELMWQTVAWSGGRISAHAHLHQQAGAPWYPLGGPTDDDRILRPFRRWGQPDPVPTPPIPPMSEEDTTMLVRYVTPAGTQLLETAHALVVLDAQSDLTQEPVKLVDKSVLVPITDSQLAQLSKHLPVISP